MANFMYLFRPKGSFTFWRAGLQRRGSALKKPSRRPGAAPRRAFSSAS